MAPLNSCPPRNHAGYTNELNGPKSHLRYFPASMQRWGPGEIARLPKLERDCSCRARSGSVPTLANRLLAKVGLTKSSGYLVVWLSGCLASQIVFYQCGRIPSLAPVCLGVSLRCFIE
jgi:hypothetical protein